MVRTAVRGAMKFTVVRLLLDLLLVYVAYEMCRLCFLFENWSLFGEGMTYDNFMKISRGGLLFDTSAICYTNSLFILLYLLPLHLKEVRWYQSLTKWLYVVVNALCIVINLADAVFFEYRRQRSNMATVNEFKGENNIMSIVSEELLTHWYLILIAAVMIWGLYRFYRRPAPVGHPLKKYYTTNAVALGLIGFMAFCGMRGNVFFLTASRPISIGYAQKFVDDPLQTALVLNTPFALIRTVGNESLPTPDYFKSQQELDAIYSPLHKPDGTAVAKNRNVVIIIVESFAQEFIGGLNKDLDGGKYKGYTPWTDSMLDSCMYFDQMFANTGFSIDSPPAVLASIPRMDRPFVLTSHSLNKINSIASELKTKGYATAFFHGADNGSLGIDAFTYHAGFDSYFGRNEFEADPRFGGHSEYDGKWGIWDEPFLQYFCAQLSEMKEPFVAGVFTLSSHHPFNVPEKYKDRFVDEGIHAIHKCIRYADYSLGRFFEEARKQPWFNNTLFVITADHGSSKRTHDVYKTHFGGFRVPVLFYDPSGELPRGCQPGIAQQIDIMPTVLSYLGYDKPYIAFGKDLLTTPADSTWAMHWDGIPQYIKGDYMIDFDFEKGKATTLYNYREDPLLKNNLIGKGLPEEAELELHFRAFIQSFLSRMNTDNATVK